MEASGAPRRGRVGEETFERVHALVDGGRTRREAFAQVAEETGRTPSTVATAFYRAARRRPDGGGVAQRPRGGPRRGAGAASGPPRGDGGGDLDAIVSDLHRAVDALVDHVRRLDAEAAALRADARRLGEIRRVIGA